MVDNSSQEKQNLEKIKKSLREVQDFPKPGINFKDITTLLLEPEVNNIVLEEFQKKIKNIEFDAIAGIESRGFLFGFALATILKKPFIMIRKKGKLPGEKVSYKYDLEYGSAEIELHKGHIKSGMKILIHDDLLATGGTAYAGAKLCELEKGVVVGFLFLVSLSFLKGDNKLKEFTQNIISLIEYDGE